MTREEAEAALADAFDPVLLDLGHHVDLDYDEQRALARAAMEWFDNYERRPWCP